MVISFPHMGDYCVPIERLLKTVFPRDEIRPAPRMTSRTIELGSRHSPDMICSPFKYNIGNFIEALEGGADVLLQTGLGCRYGYYGELQEQIMRDLGYSFTFICFSRNRANPISIYQTFRALGSPLGIGGLVHAVACAVLGVVLMDKFAYAMRENVGFEAEQGAHETLYRDLLAAVGRADTLRALLSAFLRARRAQKRIKVKKPEKALRIGIVGELYTLMEPFSNFSLEKELQKRGVSVSRRMSVTFLLCKRDWISLKRSGKYLKYTIGANGVDSVAQTRNYAQRGYDGVIHMKSFGCTPEVNATPVLDSIGAEHEIPILHLSFDAHTSEVGVLTRLEAFIDMLEARREIYGTGRGYRLHLHQGSRT